MEEQQQNLKREIASKSKLLKEREEEIALLTENETQMEREMKRLRTERKREVEENETWKREERKMKAELAQTHVTQRELLDRLEQKNSEIREKSELVETYLRKIEAYAREKSETEQSERDLGQKVKTAESARLRAEKEKSLTEEHNSWLQSELEKKSEELFRARREDAENVAGSRKKIEDLVSEKVRLVKTLATKSEALETVSAKFEKMSNDVVSLKTASARERDSYEAESRAAKRVAELLESKETERLEKIEKLEKVLKETTEAGEEASRARMSEKAVSQKKIEQLKVDLDECMEREKQLKKEVAEYRKTNEWRFTDDEMLSGLSKTAIEQKLTKDGLTLVKTYELFREQENATQVERAKRLDAESKLNDIVAELTAKAPELREMENMHDLALEENERLEIKLAESLMATESLRREVNEMREEHRSRERESHALRSQAADLSRQLALTLNEVHELKGSPAIAVPEPSPASSQQSVSDIITSRLVDFRDIAELQQKNQEMLFVIRELSEKNEHEQVDAKKEYEVKLAELREETEKQLLELKTRRDEQESVVKSIARQRDLYKSLYARATGENVNDAMDVGISPSGGGQMVLASAGASPNVKSGALVLHGGCNQEENNMQIVALSNENQNLQNQLDVVADEVERIKRNARKEIDTMLAKLEEFRERAANDRATAIEAKETVEREKHNADRWMRECEESRKALDDISREKQAVEKTIIDKEQALRNAEIALEAAEAVKESGAMRVAKLEAEKVSIETSEARLSEQLAIVESRAARIEASMDASVSVSSAKLSALERERDRLAEDAKRIREAHGRMEVELHEERERCREQLNVHLMKASDAAREAAEDAQKRNEAVAKVSEAETRAKVAESKAEMLEKTLKKTEDRLRLLNAQAINRGGVGAIATAGGSSLTTTQKMLSQSVDGMTPTDDEAVKKREKMLKDAAEKATELAERAKREKIEAVREAASHKQMFDKAEARMNEFKQMYEALEATHKEVSKALAEMTKKVSETQKQEGTDDASKSAVAEMQKQIDSMNSVAAMKENELKQAKQSLSKLNEDSAKATAEKTKILGELKEAQKKFSDAQVECDKLKKELATSASTAPAISTAQLESVKAELKKKTEDFEATRKVIENEKGVLEVAKRVAEAKAAEFEKQNASLLDQVNKAPGDDMDTDNGNEAMAYLRREKESAEAKCETLASEKDKWTRECEKAWKDLKEANDALSKVKSTASSESEHKVLLAKLEKMSQVDAENASLKVSVEQVKKEANAKVEKLTKELKEAREKANSSSASQQSKMAELTAAKVEAKRWEERASKLTDSSNLVEKSEFEKLKKESDEQGDRLIKLKKQLDLALKNLKAMNPDKLQLEEWKKKRGEELDRVKKLEKEKVEAEQAAEEAEDKLVELESAKESLEKSKVELAAKVKALEEEATKKPAIAAAATPPTTVFTPVAAPTSTPSAATAMDEDKKEVADQSKKRKVSDMATTTTTTTPAPSKPAATAPAVIEKKSPTKATAASAKSIVEEKKSAAPVATPVKAAAVSAPAVKTSATTAQPIKSALKQPTISDQTVKTTAEKPKETMEKPKTVTIAPSPIKEQTAKKEEEKKPAAALAAASAAPTTTIASPFGSASTASKLSPFGSSAAPFAAKPAFGSVLSSFATKPSGTSPTAASTPTTGGIFGAKASTGFGAGATSTPAFGSGSKSAAAPFGKPSAPFGTPSTPFGSAAAAAAAAPTGTPATAKTPLASTPAAKNTTTTTTTTTPTTKPNAAANTATPQNVTDAQKRKKELEAIMAKTKAELLEKQKAANEAKQRVAMAKRKTMEEPSAVSTPSSATGVAATPETASKKLKPDAPPFTPTSTVPKPTEKNTGDVKLEKKGSGEVAASFLVDVPPKKNTEEKEEGEAEEGELELPAPASEKKKQQQQHQQRTPGSQKKGGRGGQGGQGRGGGRGGGNNKFNNSGKKGGRGNK
ncbi:predicted protein [Bathycoccus prasinos]|uniref:Nucleoprotein TPR/MLP1 domain-containing protein n=1 Tax=Bathycoccus prasinos TaxID=41875 RepID=K8EHU2_9CHLO|nr:predicted protein [Bathycoccus prasinos]CCO17601.1 predicted protein [Bathycoccus prasinos]|eukprot:XP_007511480.1 predicted protein [Bathycoccus prasinos]